MKNKIKALTLGITAVLLITGIAASVNIHGHNINADTGYQIASAAPQGHTLIGNGSQYVDSGSVIDYYFSYTGCTIPGGAISGAYCAGKVDITSGSASPSRTAFPDASYIPTCTVALPFAASEETTGQNASLNVTSAISTTGFSYAIGASVTGPTTAQTTIIYCHFHHS